MINSQNRSTGNCPNNIADNHRTTTVQQDERGSHMSHSNSILRICIFPSFLCVVLNHILFINISVEIIPNEGTQTRTP